MPEANDINGVPDDLQAAIEAERFAEAISLLQAMLDKAPSRFDLHRKLAEVASLQGNSELAAKAARLCLDANEAGWEEFAILTNALIKTGQKEEAANVAVEFLPYLPENSHRQKEVLKNLAKDKRYSQMIALSESMPAPVFDSSFLLYHLALSFQNQGNPTKALSIAQHLLNESPQRQAYIKLVTDLQGMEHKTKAKLSKTANKRQKLDRKDVRTLVSKAEHLIKSGRPKDALQELDIVFRAGSRSLGLLIAMAQAASAAGLLNEAEMYCKEAILIAPSSAKPHILLANLYRLQNKLNEALASHESALELAPDLKRSSRERLAILEMRAKGDTQMPQGPSVLRNLPVSRYSRDRKKQLFLQDARIFFNVIWQLVLRDMKTKYARSPFGVTMALLEPLAHIALIWLIMSLLFHRGRPPIGEHWIFFYATGVLPYLMFMHLGSRGALGHRPYSRLLEVPIIKPVSVLMGAAISELLLSATATMLIFGMFYYFGIFSNVNNFYAVTAAFFTVWLLGVGFMFLNAGIASFFPVWSNVWHTLHRIIYFTSGIFHLAQLMPPVIRDIIIWNPLLIAIEWYRNGFYTLYNPRWLDLGYLGFTVGMILVIGVALETIGSKVVRD